MARRMYQQGCVFQRGTRRKVWVGRFREPVIDGEGKLQVRQRSVVLGTVAELPSLRLARVALDAFLSPLNRGTHAPRSVQTFGEFAEHTWLTAIVPTLKAATQRGYRRVLSKHVLPYWKDWPISQITKLDVQQFVTRSFGGDTAWQSIRNRWIVLSSILDAAVDYTVLEANPARGVKFPAPPLRKGPRILGARELEALLRELPEPYRTMVGVMAVTGLRIGELLAVRWQVVDLTIGTLEVRESSFEGRIQQPKTRQAQRLIPLGPQAVALFAAHRSRSTLTAPGDLVFPNRRGDPRRESRTLRRTLQPAAERAGLDRITWHQFRHVHSSLLSDLGVPVKIAQEQLGHASVQTTLNIYTHVVDASHRRAIEQLEARLFPSVPKGPSGDETAAAGSALKDSQLEIGGAARN